MRGVILGGELYGRNTPDGKSVLVFLELDEGVLHVRHSYGERALILSLELDEVEAALDALKKARQPPAPTPGQLDLERDA